MSEKMKTNYIPEVYHIIHKTEVDFTKRKTQEVVHIAQYDNGMSLIAVRMRIDGNTYKLPDGAEAYIRWGKPDSSFCRYEAIGINSDRDTVYFELTKQMTIIFGQINPIIEIKMGAGDSEIVAGSQSIPVIIDRNPVQYDSKSVSEDPSLKEYILSVIKETYPNLK